MTDLERRFILLPDEVRAEEGRRVSGTAMRYGAVAEIPGIGRERFEARAFGALDQADVILNVQHSRAEPVARTGGGGLELEDGPDALTFRAELLDTTVGRETVMKVRAGILRGASIEFRAVRERREAGVRVIQAATLSNIALVDRPAYDASTIAAREEELAHPSDQDLLERTRRGYSL